ncbi:hypothetical protein O6P43_010975 [Quillaja saponaria]|uniref:Uncharacterized protein n=1 Tax=Quillaja saponaria TaxID=32244 RepID=A0AAD7Q1L9_QUISA|nr:hypothetical protein O6P43_010975 [Quillaja saponaria]
MQFGVHAIMHFIYIASSNGLILRHHKHIAPCAAGNGSSKDEEMQNDCVFSKDFPSFPSLSLPLSLLHQIIVSSPSIISSSGNSMSMILKL